MAEKALLVVKGLVKSTSASALYNVIQKELMDSAETNELIGNLSEQVGNAVEGIFGKRNVLEHIPQKTFNAQHLYVQPLQRSHSSVCLQAAEEYQQKPFRGFDEKPKIVVFE